MQVILLHPFIAVIMHNLLTMTLDSLQKALSGDGPLSVIHAELILPQPFHVKALSL